VGGGGVGVGDVKGGRGRGGGGGEGRPRWGRGAATETSQGQDERERVVMEPRKVIEKKIATIPMNHAERRDNRRPNLHLYPTSFSPPGSTSVNLRFRTVPSVFSGNFRR
jgi:hypothetical protein